MPSFGLPQGCADQVQTTDYRCPHMGITQPFRCVGALLSKAYSQEKGCQLLSDFETGKILVVCEETTAVRSIRLALNGTMNIFWHDPVERVDHAEFEDYLGRNSISLLKSQRTFQQTFQQSFQYYRLSHTTIQTLLKSLLRFQQSY